MNEPLPVLNVPEIKRVFAHITAERARLAMQVWGARKTEGVSLMSQSVRDYPECNTQACFAGWTVLLNTPTYMWDELFNSQGMMSSETRLVATNILGLTLDEAEMLFKVGPASSWESETCAVRGDGSGPLTGQYRSLQWRINRLFLAQGRPDRV